MTETPLLQSIRLACSRNGTRLFRNNNGKLEDKTGRWVTFGLFPGSGDLIGWRSVVITPDMVGQRIARFVTIEVKSPTGHTDKARAEAQANWRNMVTAVGGIGVQVRDVGEAAEALK